MNNELEFCVSNIIENDYYANDFIEENLKWYSSDSNLFIIHTNIRSIHANFNEFKSFVHELKKKPDLIILTECWITNDTVSCSIDGFRAYYSCGSNKNGGIAVFINKNTVYLSLDSVNIIDSCDSLMIKFDCGKLKDLVLLAVYRSPSTNASVFVDSLLHKISSLTQNSHKIFAVIGDFNMCLNKYAVDKNVENLYDTMLENGFTHAIRSNTRITHSTQSLIDQIFIKNIQFY